MRFTKSWYVKRRLKMIKSLHATTPCMSTLHCPAQTTTLRSQIGRLIQSLFQADLIKHQDGCKHSSQHDDLALDHAETNRRTTCRRHGIQNSASAVCGDCRESAALIQSLLLAAPSAACSQPDSYSVRLAVFLFLNN